MKLGILLIISATILNGIARALPALLDNSSLAALATKATNLTDVAVGRGAAISNLTSLTFNHGRCSFHAQIKQECNYCGDKDQCEYTYIFIPTIKDGSGHAINYLMVDVNRWSNAYSEDGRGTRQALLYIAGIDGQNWIEFMWFKWKDGGMVKDKMTFAYKGCYFDEDTKSGCGSCKRGDWTQGSGHCPRTHDMDCSFNC